MINGIEVCVGAGSGGPFREKWEVSGLETMEASGLGSSWGASPSEGEERVPMPAASSSKYQLLEDGTVVPFRPVWPGDAVALERFHGRLSRRSVYLRYFAGLVRPPSEEKVGGFADLDGRDGSALVALDPARSGEIIAVVLYVRETGTERIELACLVEDGWQGKGLGSRANSWRWRADKGSGGSGGVMLSENARMLSLLRNLDLPKRTYLTNGLVHVELDLGYES